MNPWIGLGVALLVSAPAAAFASDSAPLSIEGSYTVTESGVRIDVSRLFDDFIRLSSQVEGWEGVGVLVGNEYIGVFRYAPSHEHAGATGRHTIVWSDADHAQVRGAFETGRVGTGFEARWTRVAGPPDVRTPPPHPRSERRAPPPPAPGADPDAPVFGEYVFVEELPEAITKVAPSYPDDARRRGVDGTVLVQALVGRDGTVKDTKVVKSIPELDAAAVASVRQWRFKPAMAKGRPVAVWVAVPVKFSLH